MSITTIQDKLYLNKISDKSIRLKAYLAVHATILRNKEVPRTYFINKSNESFYKSLTDTLHSDINTIASQTNHHLELIGISTKQLNELTHCEKSEILSVVEDLILNGYGPGYIHYEYLRITPDYKCGLLPLFDKFKFNEDSYSFLKSILEKRASKSLEFKKDLNTSFPEGQRIYHPTILSKSYQLLLEKQWRENWSHHSNYMPPFDKSLSNLVFIEDL